MRLPEKGQATAFRVESKFVFGLRSGTPHNARVENIVHPPTRVAGTLNKQVRHCESYVARMLQPQSYA